MSAAPPRVRSRLRILFSATTVGILAVGLALTGTAAYADGGTLSAAPVAASTRQGQPVTIPLLGSGPAGDQLIYTAGGTPLGFGLTAPSHGTTQMSSPTDVTASPTSVVYTPAVGFVGTDSFTYRVSDSQSDSPPATVTVTVTPALDTNRAPTATPSSVTVESPGSVDIAFAGTDPDGDALSFAVASQPAHGTLATFGASVFYTPADGYTGPDSFMFTASDGVLVSAPAVVSITVTPPRANTPPTSVPPVVTTTAGTPVAIHITGTDADGDPTQVSVYHDTVFGVVTGDGPDVTYTPAAGFVGTDTLHYDVNDGRSTSPTYAITITVTQGTVPTHTPVVEPVQGWAAAGVPGDITLRGSDPDGDPLTYRVATGPQHGTVVITGSTARYTPAPGFTGFDTFTYTASDATSTSAPATVSVDVTSGPAATPPSLDTSVSADQRNGGSRIVSPAITTDSGNRLLLAFIAADGPTTPTQSVSKVTGAGLTWSLVSRSNATWGTAEIWSAYATAPVSGAVTARLTKAGFDASITVAAFAGAAPGSLLSPTASGTKGAPSLTVNTGVGNLVWAVGHDWSRAVTPKPIAGQTIRHAFVDKRVGDTFWVQSVTPDSDGDLTVGLTSPVNDRWQLAVVEIAPALTPTQN